MTILANPSGTRPNPNGAGMGFRYSTWSQFELDTGNGIPVLEPNPI